MMMRARRHALLATAPRRWLSAAADVSRVSLERLATRPRVTLQAGGARETLLRVAPALNSRDFALRVEGGDASALFALHEETAGGGDDAAVVALRVVALDDGGRGPVKVALTLPHHVDLAASVVNGSVTLADKFEGDVKVAVGAGDVRAHKLRGTNISLKTNSGRVQVDALVEGENVLLAGDAVSCKRAMAGALAVKLGKGAHRSDFGAIYSAASSIASAGTGGALAIGSLHGYLRVNSDGLDRIQVDSVNGALEVEDSGDSCSVTAHFDSWTDDAASSILVGGDVSVSVQPNAPLEVELHGTSVAVSDKCEFTESELEQLDEDYAIFTGELKATEADAGSQASGKINVGNAKNAAMRTSFFANSNDDDESSEPRGARLLVHATKGQVTLDQLDWMENLKRKHLKK